MKKVIVLCLVLLFLVFYGFAQEASTKEYKINDETILRIDIKTGGLLEIEGWGKKIVKTSGNCDWKIEWNKRDDKIELEARCHKGKSGDSNESPTLKVFVPQTFDLEIKHQGGPIHVKNVKGNISGKTLGGELKLHRLSGTVDMKTMGGAITLTDSNLDGTLTTMGGRVLFENVVGNIEGRSMGGRVVYNNVKRKGGTSNAEPIRMKTMGGAINVNHAPNGAILRTKGGKISIKSAAKFIDAETMGGDIVVEELDGWIKASTMGGEIDVTMKGNPTEEKLDVTLENKGGDILLTIPENLSMAIEAQVTVHKGKGPKNPIVSDFPLEHKVLETRRMTNGKDLVVLGASGTFAGGKNKIKLKTWSGKIYIKKK